MSIVIVGAGPNLGMAVARRFGREGLAVGLVSRTQSKLDDLASQLEADGIQAKGAAADIRDAGALAGAIESLADELGPVEVLEYSPLPAKEFMKPLLETSAEDLRGPLEFSVLGAVAATRAVIGPMLEAGKGTILFTTGGAAVNPYPLRAGVGVSFAGEVAYARMLRDEVAERGVRVAHTAIGGSIAPGGDNEPDDVAEVLWRHHAEGADFQTRIGID
jgi:NADP-dependent 3-hydroxy acid dehydrogenase YdfG